MKEHIAAVVASWEKKEREDMEIDGLSPRVQGHLVDMLCEAFEMGSIVSRGFQQVDCTGVPFTLPNSINPYREAEEATRATADQRLMNERTMDQVPSSTHGLTGFDLGEGVTVKPSRSKVKGS